MGAPGVVLGVCYVPLVIFRFTGKVCEGSLFCDQTAPPHKHTNYTQNSVPPFQGDNDNKGKGKGKDEDEEQLTTRASSVYILLSARREQDRIGGSRYTKDGKT